MGTPFFSVIAPVYNVKKYLSQCVDSVLSQDFKDYELILVDDGSTDGSGGICDEYTKADERVRVIHKKNGGLSDARNAGMDNASGSFLFFLDSDDWLLENNAFSTIEDIIKNKNADVVFYSYKKFFESSGQYSESMYAQVPEDADIRECIRTNAYKALAWNKVVNRSLIMEHNMRFPVGRLGEDLVWCADLLAYADKIVLCNRDLIAYRQRAGSITLNENKKFRMQHIGDTLFLMNQAIEKYGIFKDNEVKNRLIGHYLAYEYSWLLGLAFPFWECYSTEIKKLSFLLGYDLNQKAAKVLKMKHLIGLWCASMVLCVFIKMKKTRQNF
ncbi:glycosyltransferase family 2 protein [Sporolactobacillus terrae]|uniref:Glycosyltransferase 2-like domain-containing protein n=1 Tax=Sporolactobacillus terrae TaxID=269673 RepID=A0ABX5Q4L0_9BACL|nr:glycosyltransferase [Sporolactobacillus terrae]QAA21577.1 hypothetical protein C0674_02460 [Sporolactobacillus terrae]QAA24549.1 hypothetical protein C0679_02440 [Sporolactobacillus terrae]